MMKITVAIPTYRRPQDLVRCLEALKKQNRQADEVIVVVRDIDTATWDFLATYESSPLPIKTATVTITGVVAAMNAGLKSAQGDIIVYTDDDAAPHPDWLERIEPYYTDETVGGVGGRDYVYEGETFRDEGKAATTVGKLQWFGRQIGNHHIGIGEAREVDLLKGVNMSFRRTAIEKIGFDSRMKGTGAQVHFEMSCCLSLKRAGWKLIYDPQITVNHHHAQRFDEDLRGKFNYLATSNQVHNETLILLDNIIGIQKIAYVLWALLIGTRTSRGIVQLIRFLPQEKLLAVQKLRATLDGRWQAWQSWRKYGNQESFL